MRIASKLTGLRSLFGRAARRVKSLFGRGGENPPALEHNSNKPSSRNIEKTRRGESGDGSDSDPESLQLEKTYVSHNDELRETEAKQKKRERAARRRQSREALRQMEGSTHPQPRRVEEQHVRDRRRSNTSARTARALPSITFDAVEDADDEPEF